MKKRKKKMKPRVITRELDPPVIGYACKRDNTIEVAPHLWPSKRLEVMVHEALHLADWKMSERKVENRAKLIAQVLWADGYRRMK